MKRTKLKTYDQATLIADSIDEDETANDVYVTEDDVLNEDEMMETLLSEGDHDATFISDFENAASEVIQNDEELAAAFNTYTEARKRLSETFRYRGFWPVSQSGKSKGHAKGKVKGKFQKGHSSSRKSLEQRILSSRCRICNKVGHWKAECPDRGNRSSQSGASAPTSFVSTDANLPMEFLQVPLNNSGTIDEPQFQLSFVSVIGHEDLKGKLRRSLNLVRETNPPIKFRCRQPVRNEPTSEPLPEPISEENVLFATHGSHGVVDLGATKTVIGSHHVAELIKSLHPKIRNQLSRCPCQVTFRFGNHGTLKSEQALVVPLQGLKLKIAIVPGSTPFLISNTLLRAFEAVIDVEKHVMWSKKFQQEYPLQLTSKGLFLIDLNVLAANTAHPVSTKPAETNVADTSLPKSSSPPSKIRSVSFQDAQQENLGQSDLANMPVVGSESFPVQMSVQPSVCSVPAKVQNRSKPLECVNSVSLSSHGIVGRTFAEAASSDSGGVARFVPVLFGSDGCHDGRVWNQASGENLQGGVVSRPTVDHMVSQALPEQQERSSPSDAALHRSQDRASRDGREEHPCGRVPTGACQEPHKGSWETIDDDTHSQGKVTTNGATGSRRSFGVGVGRDGSRRESDRAQPSREPGAAHAECGRSSPIDRHAPRAHGGQPSSSTEPGRSHRTVAGEFDEMYGFMTAGEPCKECYQYEDLSTHSCAERVRFRQLVEEFSKEFEACQSESQPMHHRRRLNLLEVFCGPNSQLTTQVRNLGGKAERLGLAQCDLQSPEGRKLLFNMLLNHDPEHVWFSPSCGPWSGWSTLNGSRSLQAWDELQQVRMQHLEQVALGLVVLRFQRSRQRHMHWEQSKASCMFKLPYLQEVHQHTLAVDFDMCMAGDLKDPENGRFIRKGMTVLSTSHKMIEHLQNKKCHGKHVHQVIEGSTVVNHNRMNRSTFSEMYPRKFARDVAKILCKLVYPRGPVEPVMFASTATALVNEPALKRRRLITQAIPKVSRSSEMTTQMQAKRRKLNGKQSSMNALEAWTRVFDMIDSKLGRVGKLPIHEENILQELQELLPDKLIKFAIACRGSNRTIAPSEDVAQHEAPWRKCAFLKRGTNRIFVEDEWENWEILSKRQRIRPSHACRINITVFAANPGETRDAAVTSKPDVPATVETSAPDVNPRSPVADVSKPDGQSPTEIKDTNPEEQRNLNSNNPPTVTNTHHDNLPQDNLHLNPEDNVTPPVEIPGTSKVPEAMKALSKEDQNMLSKIHKNMGHPSPERMSTMMLQQGFRPEMVKAARHFQCSVCTQSSLPKHARPSSLKDDLDFNDRISIDGVTWTNSRGKTFHMYHVIDWGTNFHAACIAPSKSTDAVVQSLMTMWLSWAGIPGELLVDAGSELNSDEFMTFLQSYNIRATTISPEAHFQNGKSERHGAILQHMLTKFDMEHAIQSYTDLQNATWWCIQAKNACSLKGGYAPEVLVLGKHTRLPGSVSSDMLLPAHMLAESDNAQGLKFRSQLAMRETARRAFHSADNDSALRRAMLRRSNPHRGFYQAGEWVMVWKAGSGQTPGFWQGPMKVVVHENQQTIWVTMSSKLFRCAPEHVRPVPTEEAKNIVLRPGDPTASEIARQLPADITGGITRFVDLEVSPGTESVHRPSPVASPVEMPPVIVPASNSSGQEDQPDQEPEVPVTPPAENNPSQASEYDIVPEEIPIPEVPEEIPIPDDTDDDLICEGLYCQDVDNNVLEEFEQNIGWRCELFVTDDDVQQWKESDRPEELAFLISASKRQRSEIRLSELSSSERAEFQRAKDAEVTNWLNTGTVQRMFRSQIAPEQVLRCRWVLTWKPIEESDRDPQNPSKTQKAKARLVVLGYLDPKITEIPRDSPTLNRHSKMLLLQLIASKSWTLRSFDVKAAFLQGRPQSDRILGLEPVPELATKMNLRPDEICRLAKSAYGLIDAPFLWFQALKDQLLLLGFEQSPFCPCTFILRHQKTREPEGIIGVHVDDGLCGGNDRFFAKLQELEKVYPFGSHKVGQFTFTGIDMFQHPNKSITLSQAEYVKKIQPIKVSLERRKQETEKINPEERLALRGLIGSLQYASVHTRPDLASRLSHLQSSINSATSETLLDANKTLHEAKKHSNVSITIQPIACEDLRFLAFSDASFSSKKNPDSHTGCVIMSTHKEIGNNTTCLVNPISWGCKKIQRVVTSTLAAETVSLSSVLDQLSWIRLCWAWLMDPNVRWQNPEAALRSLPQSFSTATMKAQSLTEDTVATDCKSLFDLVTRTAPPACSEFRTQLNARKIKDLLAEGIQLRWVHSGAQLADSLTKIMDTSFLRETLFQGKYRLNDELEILKARSDARTRLKWLRSNCHENTSLEPSPCQNF